MTKKGTVYLSQLIHGKEKEKEEEKEEEEEEESKRVGKRGGNEDEEEEEGSKRRRRRTSACDEDDFDTREVSLYCWHGDVVIHLPVDCSCGGSNVNTKNQIYFQPR